MKYATSIVPVVLLASLALASQQAGAEKKEAKPAGQTGPLTEEQFKALHQMKKESAPPRRGQTIDLAGGKAYLSLPEGAAAPMPGLVVIHEWWGLNEHVMHWADRIAAEGYAALAVDLYGGKVATTPDEAMAAMKAVDKAKAVELMVAAEKFLRDDARVKAPRTGSIGWCLGGTMSLELARNAPELDACAVYYGSGIVTGAEELKTVKSQVIGVFGTQDKSIPAEKVKAFGEGLTAAGVKHVIHTWDAQHAFANPSSERYDQKSAGEAWEKVRAFLAANLRAPSGAVK